MRTHGVLSRNLSQIFIDGTDTRTHVKMSIDWIFTIVNIATISPMGLLTAFQYQ